MDNNTLFNMIREVSAIKNNLNKNNITEDITENKLLYTLAFVELIRNGINFSLTKKVIGEKEEKKPFFSIKSSQDAKQLITEEYIEIKTMMDESYVCSVSQIREVLSQAEYDKLINKIAPAAKTAASKDFNLPEFDDTLGVENTEKEEDTSEENIQKSEEVSIPGKIISFHEDRSLQPDYPGKKTFKSMFFHTHTIKVKMDGIDAKLVFAVYPLKITADDPATDIVVTAVLYDLNSMEYIMPRGGISSKKSSAVNIEFDKYVFVVHGFWENGQFKSYVRKTSNEVEIIEDKIREFKPTKENMTSTTFMAIKEIPDTNVYVFPAIPGKNSSLGYIIGCIVVEDVKTKESVILSPTTSGAFVVETAGEQYSLGAFWQGSSEDTYVLNYSIGY